VALDGEELFDFCVDEETLLARLRPDDEART
jgi:hypothetical protein